MKNDATPPPLSALPQRGAGLATGGDNAAYGDGKSAAAEGEDALKRSRVHDLRNALAPIRNAAQLLRIQGGAHPDLVQITDIIERQINEIVRILDNLADAGRGARGDMHNAAHGSDGALPAPAVGRRVLIIDDNEALLTSLSAVLREAGHAVKTAADGEQGLALAQSWRPEFVLLDVHMPRMSGFEVAKQLRTAFAQDVMKLILMSGSSLDETTLRGAERAGFDHCMDKVHDFAVLEKFLRDQG